MNKMMVLEKDIFQSDQVRRIRNLINGMNHCCEDRNLIEKRKFSLPVAEMKCIILFGEEKYLTVKGISAKMNVAKSRVTKLIDNLSRRGLVKKISDPNDARVKLICLSRRGKMLVEEIRKFQEKLYEEILSRFDDQERTHVLTNLEKLKTAMEDVRKKYQL
jgi:DNA-binding MarR family transcriptional regulator